LRLLDFKGAPQNFVRHDRPSPSLAGLISAAGDAIEAFTHPLAQSRAQYTHLEAQVLVLAGLLHHLLGLRGGTSPPGGKGLRLLLLSLLPRARRVEGGALQEALLVGEDLSAQRLGLFVRSSACAGGGGRQETLDLFFFAKACSRARGEAAIARQHPLLISDYAT